MRASLPLLGLVALTTCSAANGDLFGPGIIVDQFTPPASWRAIYAEVEQCAGRPQGQFDGITWYWVETGGGPWQGVNGDTYGMTRPEHRQIYLIRDDTTYLRHEMLHDILWQGGWRPPTPAPSGGYTKADLHPSPPFGVCTGGR